MNIKNSLFEYMRIFNDSFFFYGKNGNIFLSDINMKTCHFLKILAKKSCLFLEYVSMKRKTVETISCANRNERYEPRHEKSNILQMRKQRRRSALR